jgi:putative ABC transport system permease protein
VLSNYLKIAYRNLFKYKAYSLINIIGLAIGMTCCFLILVWVLDEDYDNMYRTEERMGTLLNYFSVLAVFIACLGLFGLVSFSTEQRTKEIGIRKVLGATVPGIVMLLGKDFVKLVLLANIIAWSVAYYAMNSWLQDFAYRVNINLLVFLVTAVLSAFIALVTVSSQATKAAMTNPVKSLRYE